MDISRIKIGNQIYDIRDDSARNSFSNAQILEINRLIQAAGAGSNPGITTETDPVFSAHIASKLVASVDGTGLLTLISE